MKSDFPVGALQKQPSVSWKRKGDPSSHPKHLSKGEELVCSSWGRTFKGIRLGNGGVIKATFFGEQSRKRTDGNGNGRKIKNWRTTYGQCSDGNWRMRPWRHI